VEGGTVAALSYFQVDGQSVDPYAINFRLYGLIIDGRNHIWRMDELKKLAVCPNLKFADFHGTNLDDVGLEHVSQVATLENLDLQDTKITNDGLAYLARLPRLRHLRLKENRQLTNECVPHLLRLESLTDLQIHETSIDQHGVESLASLPNLRDICVDVWGGNYTLDGLLALSARMPECRILAKGHGGFFQGRFNGTWPMTEQEWQECSDPSRMLDHLGTKITARRVWLLAACCCARIPHLMPSDQNAIKVVERFIDGKVGEPDLRAATAACGDHAVISLCEEVLNAVDFEAIDRAIGVMVRATDLRSYEASLHPRANAEAVRLAEQAEQCRLLRHIIGNPFRPYPAPPLWPSTVVQLAESLYAGQDCAFALHDALLEAGHAELAEHFREEKLHPKGCWVMDLVLGKS
jgi:hypothetical protein